MPPQHDEVDILGLDGHIYKGRMDTRLPGILTKDCECAGGPEAPRVLCVGPTGTAISWQASLFSGPLDTECLPLGLPHPQMSGGLCPGHHHSLVPLLSETQQGPSHGPT